MSRSLKTGTVKSPVKKCLPGMNQEGTQFVVFRGDSMINDHIIFYLHIFIFPASILQSQYRD